MRLYMNNETLTPQELEYASASALEEKNREIMREIVYWRRIFAASAIQSGSSCEDAVAIADEMLKLLHID